MEFKYQKLVLKHEYKLSAYDKSYTTSEIEAVQSPFLELEINYKTSVLIDSASPKQGLQDYSMFKITEAKSENKFPLNSELSQLFKSVN